MGTSIVWKAPEREGATVLLAWSGHADARYSKIPNNTGARVAEEIVRRIVIASFITPNGAEQALALITGAQVSVGTTAVVTRDDHGEVRFTESHDWSIGKSALVGAIAGLLLPGVGTLTLAAGGALAAYLIDGGFPDALLTQMGEGLAAASSMLVMLVADLDVARATEIVTQLGGTVIGTSTESDLAAAIANLHP
jgi:uncharacterized membrane protein